MNQTVKTEIVKDCPPKAMQDMMGFGPLRAQTVEIDEKLAKEVLPEQVFNYLQKAKGELRKLTFSEPLKGAEYISFCSTFNLRVLGFAHNALDEDTIKTAKDKNDPNMDKEGYYDGRAVNLVHRASGAFPEGLLLWLPDFDIYGFLNSDFELIIFPDATWEDIEKNIGNYLCHADDNSQNPVKTAYFNEYFTPWEIWDFREE